MAHAVSSAHPSRVTSLLAPAATPPPPLERGVRAIVVYKVVKAIAMVIDFIDGTVIGTIEFTLDECGRYPEQSDYGEEACPDL